MAAPVFDEYDDIIGYDDDEVVQGPTEVGGQEGGLFTKEPGATREGEGSDTRIGIPETERKRLDEYEDVVKIWNAKSTPDTPNFPNPAASAGGLSGIFPGSLAPNPVDIKSQRIKLPRRSFNPADTDIDPYTESSTINQTSALIQAILAELEG